MLIIGIDNIYVKLISARLSNIEAKANKQYVFISRSEQFGSHCVYITIALLNFVCFVIIA